MGYLNILTSMKQIFSIPDKLFHLSHVQVILTHSTLNFYVSTKTFWNVFFSNAFKFRLFLSVLSISVITFFI